MAYLFIAVGEVALEESSLLSIQILVLTSTHYGSNVRVQWSKHSPAPLVVEHLPLTCLLSSMATQSGLQLLVKRQTV